MRIAALYARVSGEQQRDSHTIASQTEALIAYAERHGYRVAPDMIIEDDGYSGAVLERPGLERVRDLAAEGRIDTVVVHAPDRLSRRHAYQVVIVEELTRQGVETVFVNAPSMETPEDHLLVQFQGMIAEYERAQILERSRRGKRHRARHGEVAVLGGAPYGYRYHKKTPDSDAFYEVIEPQASVVREVYRCYTHDHMSIGAITGRLKEREIPTATGRSRWERSTVWAILRNPAYKETACFGKTRQMPRKSVTRPVRLRGGFASATTGGHEKPREEWIEIPVPAIVSEETFALAEERLERTPELRRQEQALHRELRSAVDRAKDREIYLRIAQTLTGFLERLRSSAGTLDIAERHRIVQLLVKEVLVSEDKITIRHAIPISGSPGGGPDPSKPGADSTEGEGCLLRSGRRLADAFQHLPAPRAGRVVRESCEATLVRKMPVGAFRR